MRSSNTLRRAGLCALLSGLAMLAAGPLIAYTIYLKDGSTLQAKGKYRIEGNRAVILLPNGTESFIDAQKIDVKRTDAANKEDYGGNAVILQEAAPSTDGTPAPPPQRRLSDVIAKRGTELPGPQREASKGIALDSVKTRSGHTDFASLPKRLFQPEEIALEIRQFFADQQVPGVAIYTGTQPSHPLVQVTVDEESAVFRGLAVGANAILHVRDRFPGKVDAFDLLLVTEAGERGGQFVLTPEMASDLVSKKVQLAAFFVENVQF
ncbi:MAG TPA: hypothetical protein VEW48_18675 [Thermoanaerobaculia bacterium]|nr:hypothetical protein [Thermoanaerobaculia bacterium]